MFKSLDSKIIEKGKERKNEKFSFSKLVDYLKRFDAEAEKKEDFIWDNFEGDEFRDKSEELEKNTDKDLIRELLNNREKFKRVFETKNGSIYFNTDTDESLRFKINQKGEFKRKTLLRKIVFIDQKTSDKLVEMKKNDSLEENIIDFEIETTDFAIDVVPLEFWNFGFLEVKFLEFERNGNKFLKIIGTKYQNKEEIEKTFASGLHLGNKVTKIL